jgi:hypothetical protein
LSTQQYRVLRGDDEPPVGVVDDPTVRGGLRNAYR